MPGSEAFLPYLCAFDLVAFFFLRCRKPCQGPGRGCCHLIQTPREDTDVVIDNLLLQYFSAELRGILSLVHYQKYMKFSPLIKRCHAS